MESLEEPHGKNTSGFKAHPKLNTPDSVVQAFLRESLRENVAFLSTVEILFLEDSRLSS